MMSSLVLYRLPAGVKCSSKNGKVYLSGVKGQVCFKSASKISRKGELVAFIPNLTPYFSSVFKQSVQGVAFGYTLVLELKGIGYRGHQEGGKLIFYLGHSKPLSFDIPNFISVKIIKKTFSFTSADYSALQNLATTIRRYRSPDSYKGKGVLYGEEKVICKEGKKN